jgi:hypothetical protein
MNMKVLKNILILAVLIVFAAACNEGIDPITPVDPGPDAAAPVVSVISPVEGYQWDVDSLVSSVRIQVEVTDDIELKSIEFLVDGVKVTEFTEFRDYRRFLKEYMLKNVTVGNHVLSVKATDLEGKVTTKTVNFSRPAYTPLYPGEVFFMPFNGGYLEKISNTEATIVGTPGFTGEANARKGSNAYKGATGSYLTFPTTGLTGNEYSAVFWYKVNSSPDRSGIINTSPAGEDRTKGFRLFREGSTGVQRIKMNVGTGAGETWNDGQEIAATAPGWVHIAMTVSASECIIYVNGSVANVSATAGPIDWTGCDVFGIGSGAPNFTYWGHGADLSSYDELRMFNKVLSQTEIQTIIDNEFTYVPKYSGEIFYMPFDGTYRDEVKRIEATKVGTPGFASGKKGQAYAGAVDSYLTFPTTEFVKSTSFSAVFWMKINVAATRAGILVAGPPDPTPETPGKPNKRTNGFRFFREGGATSQTLKSNVGIGTGEVWNDGGSVDPSGGQWVHVAYTISGTQSAVYLDGVLTRVASPLTTPMDWTGCDILSIMSGAPRFTGWDHLSDPSLMDELRIFNKGLSAAEVLTIYNDEK